jgi:hypothetical protein
MTERWGGMVGRAQALVDLRASPMRILIADSDRRLAIHVTGRLRERRWMVDVAASGEDADAFLRTAPYDLVIVDAPGSPNRARGGVRDRRWRE